MTDMLNAQYTQSSNNCTMTKNIQTEIDAAFLYQKLAEHEPDETIVNVYRQMSDIEKSHAKAFAAKENIPFENLAQPS
jgi:vacuolar iron transporter family protein